MSENPAPADTVVHMVRHGEVENPRRVLYGRLPGTTCREGRVPRPRPWPTSWPAGT